LESVISHSWIFIWRTMMNSNAFSHSSKLTLALIGYIVFAWANDSRDSLAKISPLGPQHHWRYSLLSNGQFLWVIGCSSRRRLFFITWLFFWHCPT
jgi:hypothetical protein